MFWFRFNATWLLMVCVLSCCCSKRSQLSISPHSSSDFSFSFISYILPLLVFFIWFWFWAPLTPPNSLSFMVRIITSSVPMASNPPVRYISLCPDVMRIMFRGIVVSSFMLLKISMQVMCFWYFFIIVLSLFMFIITCSSLTYFSFFLSLFLQVRS